MNRASLQARLAISEGDRLVAYLDTVGVLTVGIGHNCVARPVPGVTKVGDKITHGLRDRLFEADVDDAVAQLNHRLPWWRGLDDDRQNIMVDLCFNMGINTLLIFKNTLAAIKRGDYDAAARGLEGSLWHRQVKGRAILLEKAMRTGVYT